MNKNQIINALLAHRAELERLGIKSLSLFGSAARDQLRDNSDVDLLAQFKSGATLYEYMDAEKYLQNLLSADIDLATPRGLHRLIQSQVMREKVDVF